MNSILVIDPDLSVVALLRDVLELEGHRVTAVLSMEDAEILMGCHRFDAILADHRTLLDWCGPLSCSSRLKDLTSHAPLLCLSSYHPAVPPAIEGVRAILRKPFQIADLAAALEQALRSPVAV